MNSPIRKTFGILASSIPTVVVIAAIGGLAYWGHHTGWQAPRISQLWGTQAAAEEDWCNEHNVPESRCLACHPELAGANPADWCREHGVPESRCTICHPEILTKGVVSDWCPEHGVPESSCTLCHPEIAMKGTLPESQTMVKVAADPAAKPAKNPQTCQTHVMRVQFASAESVKKTGIRLGQVQERAMAAAVTANAEVQYARDRVARISPRVTGTVWRVEREVGQKVARGEVLAIIDAAEVGRAKAELLQAQAQVMLKTRTLERVRTSAGSGFRTEAELQEAEAALKEADIRLFNARQALINLGLPVTGKDAVTEQSAIFLGLPDSLAKGLDPATTTANLIPVVAPFDGIVIERDAVAGEVVETSKPLFVIADTSRLWVMADVPQEDARLLKVGQEIRFRPNDGDEVTAGKLSWISTAVDDRTRTLRIRADIDNPEGRLLAHTFGTARITVRSADKAIVVPTEAVQWEGCCNIVFVRLTDDIFQVRKVKLGMRQNGWAEVLIGVLPGEIVATAGSHVMKSEILKSTLGAGCADGH